MRKLNLVMTLVLFLAGALVADGGLLTLEVGSTSAAEAPVVSRPSKEPEPDSNFTFYAIYDRLVDTDSLNVHIDHAAMSGDGRRIIFSGRTVEDGSVALYTIDADGTELTEVNLPRSALGKRVIQSVAISGDGSRAFFKAGYLSAIHQLYKVQGGVVTMIFDCDAHEEINQCREIQTTADGDYVYFREDRDDLWRVGHSGGAPERVIDDGAVSRDGGRGAHLNRFAISADGSTVAFILGGYLDADQKWHSKPELFVLDGGEYRQLTDDTDGVYKDHLDISGDGTTIVFGASLPDNKWYSIRPDGGAKTPLEDLIFNVAGPALTYDGAKMFYYDTGADGGRLTNTDGSGRLDLFPRSNGANIAIAAIWDLCISDDGSRVSFRFGHDGRPLYVGYLNTPDAVPDAPIIQNISFDPPVMPQSDPDARVILTSQISDPQGLSDVTNISTDELVNGQLERDVRKLPVYFYWNAHDDGQRADQIAADGIFSSEGKIGKKVDHLDQMTVRIGVMDASKTVVVADATLEVKEPILLN